MTQRLKIITAFLSLALNVPMTAVGAQRPPDPCDKELSVGDMEGILSGTITVKHYSISESRPGEGCQLGVTNPGSAFVDISLRHGDRQVFQNLLFFVPPKRMAIAGIGDEAYIAPTMNSNVPDVRETDLFARKGNLICIVQLHRSAGGGENLIIPTTENAMASKLGGLCVRLFAARGAE